MFFLDTSLDSCNNNRHLVQNMYQNSYMDLDHTGLFLWYFMKSKKKDKKSICLLLAILQYICLSVRPSNALSLLSSEFLLSLGGMLARWPNGLP